MSFNYTNRDISTVFDNIKDIITNLEPRASTAWKIKC